MRVYTRAHPHTHTPHTFAATFSFEFMVSLPFPNLMFKIPTMKKEYLIP